MADYKFINDSGIVRNRPGFLNGFLVSTHSSGTLKLYDGTEGGAAAVSTLTYDGSGTIVQGFHATNTLTSTGAMVAGSHAQAVLTSGGTNFKDAVAASLALTSDQTNVTAADTVTIDGVVFTFRAQANMNDPTDVLIGATAAETVLNLLSKIPEVSTVTAALTSTYVITVTAKTPGTGGNSIAVDEGSTHLAWAGGATALAGGLSAETVTIGTTVYTFKDGPLQTAYQVKIGATLTASLLNLKYAINGTLPPVGYAQGTSAHASVICTASDATTLTIRGRVPGTSLNTLATTETCADAAWGGTTLGGAGNTAGVTTGAATCTIGANTYTVVAELSETLGAAAIANQVLKGANEAAMLTNLKAAINGDATAIGTTFSTGTVFHPYICATTLAADSLIVRARHVGDAAYTAIVNALATTETMANTAWTAVTMGAGTGASDPSITTDAALITIGTRVYSVVVELDETLIGSYVEPPASQIAAGAVTSKDQILWVTNEATFLDNVKKAINASGIAGTDYSTGTTQNTQVKATTNGNTTQIIEALEVGTGGNAIATACTCDNYTWTSTVMASGTGATGKILVDTITFPAVTVGPLTYNFPEPISFQIGLYATVGGTASITLELNK